MPKNIPKYHKKVLFEKLNGKCEYCGKQTHISSDGVVTDDTATLDHVLPRSQTVKGEQNFYMLACYSCNTTRDTIPITKWLDSCIANGMSKDYYITRLQDFIRNNNCAYFGVRTYGNRDKADKKFDRYNSIDQYLIDVLHHLLCKSKS